MKRGNLLFDFPFFKSRSELLPDEAESLRDQDSTKAQRAKGT
jgi:hypothetical protein